MKYHRLIWLAASIVMALQLTAQPAGAYLNPVIPGFNPDPSICRVGNDYYVVNSTFQFFPGVPIYHSTDMVNWEQIGNVLTRESQLPLNQASSWLGIYATTIRYHEGTFYMITTNVGNGGNFMVTATDPRGPWSEPIWLKQQGIDPSLYWEDGHCYMVSNPGDKIWLCEIDDKTGEQLTESVALWCGDGGRFPEAPHIYKKDGYYYLLISEGGTELAHSLTIARSKNIEGPYISNPANPIMTNCSQKGQTLQVQGTGHGDFVQAPDGSWWVVFLAYRNFGGSYHHLGRETYLAPVQWPEGGWPVVNGGEPIETLMQANLGGTPVRRLRTVTHEDLMAWPERPMWMHMQSPIEANYERIDGRLRLHAGQPVAKTDHPTFIGMRQTSERMTVQVDVDAAHINEGDEAGIIVYQIEDGWQSLSCTRQNGELIVKLDCRLKTMRDIKTYILDQSKARLRISSDGLTYRYECSTDVGNTWHELGSQSCTLLSTEMAGGFTGVVLVLYAQGSKDTYADFTNFGYQEY